MTVEPTTRLQIDTWTDDADPFTREQMTSAHLAIDDRVAQFLTGTTGLPPATPRTTKSFFLDTTTDVLYFFTSGNEWRALNAHAAPTTTLAPNGTNTAGSAHTYSRSDHSHAMLPWATTMQPVGTASSAGTNDAYAREDHVHVIGTGAINDSTMLANSVVVATKIAIGAVETQRIAVNAVTKDRLAVEQQLPTGMIAPFAGAAAPTGWVLCNGQDYSPTDSLYVALHAVIGTTYGTAGSNFRVPDLRNRVPQGAGTTDRGVSAGGSATITETHLPQHTHESGTYTTSTVDPHQHAAGGLATNTTGAHAHTTTIGAHNHGITPDNTVPLIYRPGTAPLHYQLTSATNVLTVPFGMVTWKYEVENASGAGPKVSDTQGNHQHPMSGNTANAGSHNHVISGTSASTGNGQPLTVSTAHVGVNYIIKL